MKHPALLFVAALIAVIVVSFTAYPARTAPQTTVSWADTAPVQSPPTLQSSSVRSMVGSSFRVASAGF